MKRTSWTAMLIASSLMWSGCGSVAGSTDDAFAELQGRIDDLEAENAELRAELDELADEHPVDTEDKVDETEPTEPEPTDDERTIPESTEPTDDESGDPSARASIEASGFMTFDAIGETWASLGARVTNETDEDLFYVDVTFNIIGADGTPVATESAYIEVLPAGETMPAVTSSLSDLSDAMPVTVEATVFADDESFFETEWVEMELAGATIEQGEYSTTMRGTVTNPTDEALEFFPITCLFIGADDSILGGYTTYSDTVAPGQTIAWETGGSELDAAAAAGATPDCRSIASLS